MVGGMGFMDGAHDDGNAERDQMHQVQHYESGVADDKCGV